MVWVSWGLPAPRRPLFRLGLARSRREGDATSVRPHPSLPFWGPGPGAQAASPRGALIPLHVALGEDRHRQPRAAACCLLTARPGPASLGGMLFLFPLADLGGKGSP